MRDIFTSMKNIYITVISVLTILPALLISGCRKDKSGFITPNVEQGYGDNRNCQVLTYGTEDQSSVATYKYQLDTVLTEVVTTEEGEVDDAWYLTIENPKQLLVFHNDKNPASAVSRMYLNQDGSIEKEVAVTLNPDGTTYTEQTGSENTFVYNDKKQLIRMDINMETEDVEKGKINFTYDEKNRIKKIAISDEDGQEGLIYDNFTYDPQAKNDNFVALDLFESPASYFIPSLRNVYIKGYRIYTPVSDLFTTVYAYNYTFADGKLSGVDLKVKVLGVETEVKLGVTLKCK